MASDGVTANVVYPPVTDTGWITDEVRDFVANDFDHHHIAEPGAHTRHSWPAREHRGPGPARHRP
jgi:hypothetical protein